MRGFTQYSRARRTATVIAGITLSLVAGGAVLAAASPQALHIITPKFESQVTNLDVLRLEIENYYGTPNAKTGSGATASWTLPLNLDSNYAAEAEGVAADGSHWLAAKAKTKTPSDMTPAIVLDVDDTTLATWNYELYANWAYNPATNGDFVNGELFPAVPGMVDMVTQAQAEGYQIIYITGRPTSQAAATEANLTGVGLGAGALGQPAIDAGYPDFVNLTGGLSPLFTKPSDPALYPSYLTAACASDPDGKCTTIHYKSATREYIESLGYDIVASFGDQYSDLIGGYADRTFKMPNPNYYLP